MRTGKLLLVLVVLGLLKGASAMAGDEDVSMMLFRGSGGQLATREIALKLAEMVFKGVYGEEDYKEQLPWNITDGGDRWIIEGSRKADAFPPPPGKMNKGKAEVVILKANCQVVKFQQKAPLPFMQ